MQGVVRASIAFLVIVCAARNTHAQWTVDPILEEEGKVYRLLLVDRHLWTHGRNSLSKINLIDGSRETIALPEHVLNRNILRLTPANDGGVWVATNGSGLLKLNADSTWAFPEDFGIPSDAFVHAVEQEPTGTLWVGTSHGLYRHDGRGAQLYSEDEGLPSKFIWSLLWHNDRLWVGTGSGIAIVQNSTIEVPILDYADTFIHDIEVGPWGALWFGTDNGVIRHADGSWDIMEAQLHGSLDEVVRIVADPRGVLWFAMYNGLIRYDGNDIEKIDGLPSDYVSDISLGMDGSIYVSLLSGVYRLYGN